MLLPLLRGLFPILRRCIGTLASTAAGSTRHQSLVRGAGFPRVGPTAPPERPQQNQEGSESLLGAEFAHVVSGGRLVRGAGMMSRACSHHRLSSLHLPDLVKEDDYLESVLGSPDKGHQLAASNPLRCPSLPISVSSRRRHADAESHQM